MSAQKNWIDFKTIKADAEFGKVLTHYQISFKAGQGDFKVSCPFHDDSRPSCSINPKKKIFQCFGCPAKGNILDFVCQMEGTTDLRKGAKVLQSISGGSNVVPIKKGNSVDTTDAHDAMRDEWCPKIIPEGYIYLGNGILRHLETDPLVIPDAPGNKSLEFELKLDHEHIDLQMYEWFTPQMAKQFGIGVANRGTMKGRICFPITNKDGELVAYAGRWPNDDVPEGEGKYKLPKGFQKSLELFLFSHHFNEAVATKMDTIVLVEGFWAAILLSSLGYPAVAMMGRSISQEQIELITSTSSIQNVIVLMDGDEAGREAEPGVVSSLARFLPTRCISLNDGFNVDQFDSENEDWHVPRIKLKYFSGKISEDDFQIAKLV